MKIGILTYQSVYNFGANLQLLSTVGFLKKNGHEPRVINWVAKDLKGLYDNSTPNLQIKEHELFFEQYIPLTKICENSNEISKVILAEKIEAIIIGSDSLFNLMKPKFNWFKLKTNHPTSDHTFPNPFWGEFLNFNSEIPIAGLSISSQNCNYFLFKSKKKIIGDFLTRFKYISVRDNWTRDLVKYFTSNKIVPNITPDPVFNFSNNIPIENTKTEFLKKFNLPNEYFLLSFTGGKLTSAPSKWLIEFKKNAKLNDIACVQLPRTTGGQELNLEYSINRPLSPIDWYYLIKYSRGYVGVLMHPIVTALHNNVPFFSFDHYGIRKFGKINKTSSKTYHIIHEAGLESQHFSLNLFNSFPSAKKVVDSLINFNYKKCEEFSLRQKVLYEDNMNKIINSFGCID